MKYLYNYLKFFLFYFLIIISTIKCKDRQGNTDNEYSLDDLSDNNNNFNQIDKSIKKLQDLNNNKISSITPKDAETLYNKYKNNAKNDQDKSILNKLNERSHSVKFFPDPNSIPKLSFQEYNKIPTNPLTDKIKTSKDYYDFLATLEVLKNANLFNVKKNSAELKNLYGKNSNDLINLINDDIVNTAYGLKINALDLNKFVANYDSKKPNEFKLKSIKLENVEPNVTKTFEQVLSQICLINSNSIALFDKAVELNLLDYNKLMYVQKEKKHFTPIEYCVHNIVGFGETAIRRKSIVGIPFLQYLIKKKNKFTQKEKDDLLSMVNIRIKEVNNCYNYATKIHKTFETYLSNDLYRTPTDYVSAKITLDDVNKIKNDKSQHYWNDKKKVIETLKAIAKGDSIALNEDNFYVSYYAYEDEKEGIAFNDSITEEQGYELRLKFIKVLIKNKLVRGNSVFLCDEILKDIIMHLHADYGPTFFNYALDVVKVMCNSDYLYNDIKNKFRDSESKYINEKIDLLAFALKKYKGVKKILEEIHVE